MERFGWVGQSRLGREPDRGWRVHMEMERLGHVIIQGVPPSSPSCGCFLDNVAIPPHTTGHARDHGGCMPSHAHPLRTIPPTSMVRPYLCRPRSSARSLNQRGSTDG